MLICEELKCSLGGINILNGVSFEWKRGECIALLGRSGGGKSVLLRCILGLEELTEGRVWWDGREINYEDEADVRFLRENLGMVFQNGALFDSINVWDNVAVPLVEGAEGEKYSKKEIDEKVEAILSRVGVRDSADKYPSEISGGMKKRVALARAVIAGAKGMMYDEPTAGLDPMMAESIDLMIRDMAKTMGMGALLVTHEMESVKRVAQKVMVLAKGKIIWMGSLAEMSESEVPEVKEFWARVEREI